MEGVLMGGNVRLLALKHGHRLVDRRATLPGLDDAGIATVGKGRPILPKIGTNQNLVPRPVRNARFGGLIQRKATIGTVGIDELLGLEIELARRVGITAARAQADDGPIPLGAGTFVEQGRSVPHPRLGRVRRGRGEGIEVQDGRPLGILGFVRLQTRAPPNSLDVLFVLPEVVILRVGTVADPIRVGYLVLAVQDALDARVGLRLLGIPNGIDALFVALLNPLQLFLAQHILEPQVWVGR